MPDGAQHSSQPIQREALVALLETRGRLLQPDPDLIARALRRCARYDMRSGRERFSHVSVDEQGESVGAPTEVTDSVAGLSSSDHHAAVEDASAEVRVTPARGEAEGAGPFSVGIPSDVAKAATVPEEDGSAVEQALAAKDPTPTKAKAVSRPLTGGLFQVGNEIAGYRIEGRLGRGGMGDVYRATQLSMGREVAFKVLSKKLAGDAVFRARFLREARAAGRLQHPNLIAVHDVGEAESLLFFSMELVEGRSVGDVLKHVGSYDEGEALEVVRQVLEALKYAHAHGLVHRDIKPDNIMVTERGMVKVADLGLARQVEDEEGSRAGNDQTKSGTMMGTPYYMPPEQGQDARNADARSDIYALGATLYHMVVGAVPYRGRTPVEVVVNASTKPLTFPEDKASPKLRRLIARFMAKDPADRPHDAEEAMIMLQRMLGGGSAPVVSGASGRYGERTSYMRSRYVDGRQGLTVWLVIGAVVLVLLIGTLVLLDQYSRGKTWDDFTGFVQRDLEEHRYAGALERITAFQAAQPDFAQRAEDLRRQVVADWDERSLAVLDSQLAEFDTYLRQGDYREAMRIIELAGRDRSIQSPAASERLATARDRLMEQQDLAITTLREDVEAGLEAGRLAAAFAQADGFGPPTHDRQAEVELITRHAAESWDAAVVERAAERLDEIRRSMSAGRVEQARRQIAGLRGQEHLASPAVEIQLRQLEIQLDRAGQTGYRFDPVAWFGNAQTWGKGARVESLDDGRFRFRGTGRVSLSEDPEMPVGMHLDLDLQIMGEVDWAITFGRLGEGRLVRVTGDQVQLATLPDLRERRQTGRSPEVRRDMLGELIAQAGHRGSLRIRLVWLKDAIELNVVGLDAPVQRIERGRGLAAFHLRWNNEGAVIVAPRLGR